MGTWRASPCGFAALPKSPSPSTEPNGGQGTLVGRSNLSVPRRDVVKENRVVGPYDAVESLYVWCPACLRRVADTSFTTSVFRSRRELAESRGASRFRQKPRRNFPVRARTTSVLCRQRSVAQTRGLPKVRYVRGRILGLPECGAAPRDKLLRPADANTATLDGRPGGGRGYKRRNALIGAAERERWDSVSGRSRSRRRQVNGPLRGTVPAAGTQTRSPGCALPTAGRTPRRTRVKGNKHDFESGSGGDLPVSSETARGSYTTPCTKSSSPRPGPMGFSRLSGGPNDDALRKRSGEPAGQACRLLLSGLVPRRRVGRREASASGAILPRRRYRGLRRVGR
ncbi:hypothetical protein MRX96_058730 [Rhipicephalus microplus]